MATSGGGCVSTVPSHEVKFTLRDGLFEPVAKSGDFALQKIAWSAATPVVARWCPAPPEMQAEFQLTEGVAYGLLRPGIHSGPNSDENPLVASCRRDGVCTFGPLRATVRVQIRRCGHTVASRLSVRSKPEGRASARPEDRHFRGAVGLAEEGSHGVTGATETTVRFFPGVLRL